MYLVKVIVKIINTTEDSSSSSRLDALGRAARLFAQHFFFVYMVSFECFFE